MAQLTKADWEEFRASGRARSGARPDIIASWKRSSRLPVSGLKQAPYLTEEQVEAVRRGAKRFLRASVPAVRKAGDFLNQTGNMVLLCDASGVVIEQAGDRDILERGRENRLHVGGRWREGDIGTNAIGLAIETRMPVQVAATEHYSEEIQRWSCAATPVRDPVTGQVLGIVDVSWPAGKARDSRFALSAMLGLQAETVLRQNLMQEHERLKEFGNLRHLRRGSDPMAVLDRYGAEIMASDDLHRYCADDSQMRRWRETLPAMLDEPTPDLEDRLRMLLLDLDLGLDLELIRHEQEPIGLLLRKTKNRAASKSPVNKLDQLAQVGSVTAGICAQARRLAQSLIPLSIEGETGVGKSTFASAIHLAGSADEGGFEQVDCSLLTAEKLQADLAVNGAFDRILADCRTLCLESPAATPPDAQKLLLSLVERASAEGVRLISISRRNLYSEMKSGRFLSDLYFRLAAARLELVPLRERREEIVPELLAIDAARAASSSRLNFTASALATLTAYDWPGNLREMANLVDLLRVISPSGLIDHRTLPAEFRPAPKRSGETLRDAEREQILEAIDLAQGNMTKAARRLGIARSTLYLKLDALGISRSQRSG